MDLITRFRDGLRKNKVDTTVFAGKDESHIFNLLEPKYSKNKETRKESLQCAKGWFQALA